MQMKRGSRMYLVSNISYLLWLYSNSLRVQLTVLLFKSIYLLLTTLTSIEGDIECLECLCIGDEEIEISAICGMYGGPYAEVQSARTY